MIEYHADDYGMSLEQSKRIIDCIDNGVINGISIMPNSPAIDECMKLIKNKDIKLSVHLNFCEGKCLTKSKYISKDGLFKPIFLKLLIISYIPWLKKKYKQAYKEEIKQQLSVVSKYFENKEYRLDSHCHYHMIPFIFDALVEVIKEENIEVSYIRIPVEDSKIYKNVKIKFINRIKNIILKDLYKRNYPKHKEVFNKLGKIKFYGILFSGHMDSDVVKDILANTKNEDIEILFHPGSIREKKQLKKITNKYDLEFFTSINRLIESDTLKLLK